MVSYLKNCFTLTLMVCLVVNISVRGDSYSKLTTESTTCGLLSLKLVASNPWTTYPIIYEPTHRGRLTVWTGISTLPTSEFKCYANTNTTNEILLEFANFANKLEWTFYDMNKGITHHGVSVNHCDEVKFRVRLSNGHQDSYLDCNSVIEIQRLSDSHNYTPHLQSHCIDCSHPLLALINNQLRELIKLKLDEQIKENLYWDISQLITNQHFNGPIALEDNSD